MLSCFDYGFPAMVLICCAADVSTHRVSLLTISHAELQGANLSYDTSKISGISSNKSEIPGISSSYLDIGSIALRLVTAFQRSLSPLILLLRKPQCRSLSQNPTTSQLGKASGSSNWTVSYNSANHSRAESAEEPWMKEILLDRRGSPGRNDIRNVSGKEGLKNFEIGIGEFDFS